MTVAPWFNDFFLFLPAWNPALKWWKSVRNKVWALIIAAIPVPHFLPAWNQTSLSRTILFGTFIKTVLSYWGLHRNSPISPSTRTKEKPLPTRKRCHRTNGRKTLLKRHTQVVKGKCCMTFLYWPYYCNHQPQLETHHQSKQGFRPSSPKS